VEREAARRGLRVTDAEVAAELDRRGQALEDPQRVRQMQQRYGVTLQDLRVRVRQQLYVRKFNRLLREDLERRTTEEDLRRYYRDHLYQFRHPEQAYVRFLVVRDRERARRLRQRLARGEDFAELARRYSEHPTRDRGGEWGWVPRGVREWEPVFRLPPGGVSEPFSYRGLWWVVKVERVRGPGVQPFEEVRDRVREQYLAERLQQEQVRITEELRRKARVEVLVP
jgi:parvulin-like peptidyl-prolyl isomerase